MKTRFVNYLLCASHHGRPFISVILHKLHDNPVVFTVVPGYTEGPWQRQDVGQALQAPKSASLCSFYSPSGSPMEDGKWE